ncbi:MAG: HD domain-containing protein [Lachnospiraceae bacterium]|nr:HD domain-containing protein [Lachnospiraceae bacterium]
MREISSLKEGDRIREVYLCKTKLTQVAKNGKNYYALTLQDKTGQVDGKVWELTNAIESFEPMDFIQVDATVTVFRDAPQLNITRVRKASPEEYDVNDYIPATKKDRDILYKKLMGYISSMSDPHLKALCEEIFIKDRAFARVFASHSAAKMIHHGYMGGLLEHTVSVADICSFYADQYEIINRDLLLTAALCHDIGKTRELSPLPKNDFTDEGYLMGHILIGIEMVGKKIEAVPGFPELLKLELLHCIAAHHGELEYGSPKKPEIIEAVALHLADNMDARAETFREAMEAAKPGEKWLGFNKFFDTNIRITE